MNFYNNSLTSKKYLSILKRGNKIFDKEFIFQNSGMLMGDKSFYRMLSIYNLLNEIKHIKGCVIEFGIWNGNNLFSIKKILDFLKIKKKVIGYDNFSGFPNPVGHNKKKSLKKGIYAGKPGLIKFIIKFFKLDNILIINDDILNLNKHINKLGKISFVYIDCNIYEPVKIILELVDKRMSKGGIIAFDEGLNNSKSGEGKALKEFVKKNKKKYKFVKLLKSYQPDILLKKINSK